MRIASLCRSSSDPSIRNREDPRARNQTSLSDVLPEVNDLRNFLAEAEKTLILRTLKSTNGAQAEAARRLGISRSDLGYKITKYGISEPACKSCNCPQHTCASTLHGILRLSRTNKPNTAATTVNIALR